MNAGTQLGTNTGINSPEFIVYFLICFIFGIAYAVFVARYARKHNMLSRDPQQSVWAVIFGSGFVVLIYGLWAGIDAAVQLFALFLASGMPMVVEHFYSTQKYHIDEQRKQIMTEVIK